MSETATHSAPLDGVRIIEFAGIGPGPFACMMLADMGAEIIRIERPVTESGSESLHQKDFMLRGRKSIALNLKSPEAAGIVLKLLKQADGLVEGFRPGVMERLGIGPDICLQTNPKLVYGRMTGWGQDGPLANAAGHDLNYIALTGALWATGEASRPPAFAMNLLGDFGGGGMYLAYGMVCALLKAQSTGHGDVIDASICDGTLNLMTFIHARRAMGEWKDERQANFLDGGVPWYAVYECADGHWISIAPLEPQFWSCLLKLLEITDEAFNNREDEANWPTIRTRLEDKFKSRPRQHWVDLLEGTDACFAPVLSPVDAARHPHIRARSLFVDGQSDQPAVAPRFQQAVLEPSTPVPACGDDSKQVLLDAGFAEAEVKRLMADKVVQGRDTD